jgi:hypothetical protein
MIYIEKDQIVAGEKNLRVASSTGEYEDNALIEFYDISNPNIIIGAFAAQYIKYGSLVYKFSDHKELGEAILEIDPSSTHSTASFVRMNRELTDQMNKGSLGEDSLDQAASLEKELIQENKKVEEVLDEDDAEAQEEIVEEEIEEDVTEESDNTSEEDEPQTTEEETEEVGTNPEVLGEEVESDAPVIVPEAPVDVPAEEVVPEPATSISDEILGFFSGKKTKSGRKLVKSISKSKKVIGKRRRIM